MKAFIYFKPRKKTSPSLLESEDTPGRRCSASLKKLLLTPAKDRAARILALKEIMSSEEILRRFLPVPTRPN